MAIYSLAAFVILTYGTLVEPYWLEVTHLYIENEYLNKALQGKTAVHLSDPHISDLGRRENAVLEKIEELQPDLIFLTGDYVQWRGDYEPALDFLSKLQAGLGVWAVMGDYDYSNSRKSCLFCHEEDSSRPSDRHNVWFLRNSVEFIDVSRGSIGLGGIDRDFERPFVSGEKMPSETREAPTIILSHDPLLFDEYQDDEEVLFLAGNTHGGQIPLPSWLWHILGYRKNALYNQGLFRKGKKQLYVSRGIGTSHFPIRILRRPEIVVLHF